MFERTLPFQFRIPSKLPQNVAHSPFPLLKSVWAGPPPPPTLQQRDILLAPAVGLHGLPQAIRTGGWEELGGMVELELFYL